MSDFKGSVQTLVFPVSAGGRSVVSCPSCGARNELDVSRFKKRTIPLRYTCSCGNSFPCLFNFSPTQANNGRVVSEKSDLAGEAVPIADIATGLVSSQDRGGAAGTKKAQVAAPGTLAAPAGKQMPAQTRSPRTEGTILTVPVDGQGRARIVCPHCSRAKVLTIKTGQFSGQAIPVTCGCGESFSCRFIPQQRLAAVGKRNVYFPLLQGEFSGKEPLVFHVDSKGEATIICPSCNNYKIIIPSEDQCLNGMCGFRCKCGALFPFKIDFRRAYRKPVDLEGTFYNYRQKEKGELRVKNLSLGGIGIYVDNGSLGGVHGIKVGDILEVSFCLDDAMHSEVNRRVKVRTISGSTLGCQFSDQKAHDKELGFYLMA